MVVIQGGHYVIQWTVEVLRHFGLTFLSWPMNVEIIHEKSETNWKTARNESLGGNYGMRYVITSPVYWIVTKIKNLNHNFSLVYNNLAILLCVKYLVTKF
uniref:Uncharacterized protein n=1 Tax=Cacopsylla melanoneura TaxID=428564 RepID=A0A8D8RCG0_9HEMI